MPRKRRPLDRISAVRDAKLIIIATEDAKATPKYLEDFVSSKYYPSTRVQVRVLHPNLSEHKSAPEHILSLIDDYKAEFQIDEDDEFWLVIDVDNWGESKLNQVLSKAHQKSIKLAVSNPAIEVWFLMHVADLSCYSQQDKKKLFENKRISKSTSSRKALDQELLEILGEYKKSNINPDHFLPYVDTAINHAKLLGLQPNDRWPQSLGSHVYRLAESIIKLSES